MSNSQLLESLILEVEGPVLGVRQLVVNVISAIQEGAEQVARRPASRITAGRFGEVGQVGEKIGGIRAAGVGGAEPVPKGVERPPVFGRSGNRLNERRR